MQVATLGLLVGGVLKKRLAVNTPNLLCGGFMYEEGEPLQALVGTRKRQLLFSLLLLVLRGIVTAHMRFHTTLVIRAYHGVY